MITDVELVAKYHTAVHLQSGSVHITWKTLLPSNRHNQGFVWIDLTQAQMDRRATFI